MISWLRKNSHGDNEQNQPITKPAYLGTIGMRLTKKIF